MQGQPRCDCVFMAQLLCRIGCRWSLAQECVVVHDEQGARRAALRCSAVFSPRNKAHSSAYKLKICLLLSQLWSAMPTWLAEDAVSATARTPAELRTTSAHCIHVEHATELFLLCRICLSRPAATGSVEAASAMPKRRDLALLLTPAALLPALQHLAAPPESQANALSDTWQAMGGGPPDLYFPEDFLGTWTVRLRHNVSISLHLCYFIVR